MRLLLMAGRVARQRWSPARRVVEIACALRRRGHTVILAAESIDDDAPLRAEGIEPVVFGDFRQHKDVRALGFSKWANRQSERTPREATLSLTWGAPADVWFPLDAAGGAWLAEVRRRSGPLGAGKSGLKHWEAIIHRAGDTLARAETSRVHRVLTSGVAAAQRLSGVAPGRLRTRIDDVGFASAAKALSDEETAWLRVRTRAALGVSENRRLVAVSITGPAGGGRVLDDIVGGLALLLRREPDRAPVLVFLAGEGFAVHAALERAAGGPQAERLRASVRIAGLTQRVERVLAACEAAAAPVPGLGVPGAAEHGRFIADALRLGRPVLAAGGASGAELLGLEGASGPRPGMVLRAPSADEWSRALASATDDGWLAEASAESRRAGERLGLDDAGGWVERLEALLAECA